MKKLRIVISSETYPPETNGAARFAENLAMGLASRGHKVAVIAPGRQFVDEVENGLVKVYRIKSLLIKPIHHYFRFVSPINLNKKIKKIFDEFNPQIIHIQNHFLLGRSCLYNAKKLNIPIIGTNHFMPENIILYFPRLLRRVIKKKLWKDFLKIYNQLNHVTTPSNAAKNILERINLQNNISVISNGVNLKKFSKVKIQKAIFKKFKIKKNIFTFISVGRLEKEKNLDLVFRALKIIPEKTSLQYIVVGRGRDENMIMKISRKLGLGNIVNFTGEVNESDLQQLFSLADVFIAPGYAELQGIAVMEAMVHGLPILALNAVALPELVDKGVNGFLFEFDEKELSEKMLDISSLNLQQLKIMGENSYKLVQKHNLDNVISKFEKLYFRIVVQKNNKVH